MGVKRHFLLLRNCVVDFVEICNVYIRKMIIKVVKRIFNSHKICRSYSDLNFGVTFLEHSVYYAFVCQDCVTVTYQNFYMYELNDDTTGNN